MCMRMNSNCAHQVSVEVLAIILFGVLGLSHLLQPKAWAEFFILLRGKREAGAFVDGFLNLPLAGVIIGFHNVWCIATLANKGMERRTRKSSIFWGG
jgi:hypothetical protein